MPDGGNESQPHFTCPVCGMTSYNPNDIREGYCGNCHAWTGPQAQPDKGPQAQLDKALTLGRLKSQWEKAIRQTFPDATDGQCVGLAVQLFLACQTAGVDLYVRTHEDH
jgi:hypothetical protein